MCDLFTPRDVDLGPGRANVVLHVALERVADAAVRAEGGDGEETSSGRMPGDTVLHRVDVKDSLNSGQFVSGRFNLLPSVGNLFNYVILVQGPSRCTLPFLCKYITNYCMPQRVSNRPAGACAGRTLLSPL